MSFSCHPLSNLTKFEYIYTLNFRRPIQKKIKKIMASTLEMQSSSYRKQDDSEFNLTEWSVKGRISRENTKPRRYSASIIRSFREDTTFSSTASSPGCLFKETIDPSTYSFTTALKALQARSFYKSWECLSPDGFALNSKWNEAEKYICNPLSGEVPMECLSAKTLSARSFHNSTTNIITISSPLVYSSRQQTQTKPSNYGYIKEDIALQFHIPEKNKEGMVRDISTQNTPPYFVSSNPSTALTPSIVESSAKLSEHSVNSDDKSKSEEEVEVKDKTTCEITEKTGRKMHEYMKKDEKACGQGGCFSWIRKKKEESKRKTKKE